MIGVIISITISVFSLIFHKRLLKILKQIKSKKKDIFK